MAYFKSTYVLLNLVMADGNIELGNVLFVQSSNIN